MCMSVRTCRWMAHMTDSLDGVSEELEVFFTEEDDTLIDPLEVLFARPDALRLLLVTFPEVQAESSGVNWSFN